MATINNQPAVLDLALYAGDGVEFRLICTNGNEGPVDITGSVKAQVRLNRTDEDEPVAYFTVGLVDAYQGIIVLSLSDEQTQALVELPSASQGKFMGVWDVEWEPANAHARTLCQGTVECVADVTR